MLRKFGKALRWGTFIAVFAILASSLPGVSHAAGWPKKAIQWIVVFSPGGGSDTIARVLAPYISRELGVPVNVINKPGGNQIPAINYVMNSPPDGYILLQEQQAASAIKSILKDLPIDIGNRTFGPLIAGGANAIVVNGKSPWKNLKDMVAFAKKSPGEFTYWRAGGSSFTDMVNKLLFRTAGLDPAMMKAVDYKGAGPGNVAVAGGHVMMGGGGAGSVISLVRSGDLKALAVTGTVRVGALPDVPSANEAGFPELNLVNWYGVSGPPGLPAEVMQKMDEVVRKLHKDQEFIKAMDKLAHYPFYKSPAETRPFVLEEAKFYKKMAGG
jgi:tripartite-type tricarboxylate transporter receptor subunit TctC